MIKISSWICGTCLIVWIIYIYIGVVFIAPPASQDWGSIFIITAIVAIGSFVLSYLGGHIIKGNKGALRLGVLISVLWVIGTFVYFEPYNKYRNLDEFLCVGIIPVISYLGILWVISGFLPKQNKLKIHCPTISQMKYLLKFTTIIILLVCSGCAEHKVDTFQEWYEQISGVDLDERYRPFWAVIFGISFDGDAIRDDYTESLNKLHLEKVGNRAPKMAWRKGTELHLVNLSSLLVIEPKTIIEEWRKGIELSKEYKHNDPKAKCLYGTLTSLFDSLHIHSMQSDAFGKKWTEEVTVILTDREERLGEERL